MAVAISITRGRAVNFLKALGYKINEKKKSNEDLAEMLAKIDDSASGAEFDDDEDSELLDEILAANEGEEEISVIDDDDEESKEEEMKETKPSKKDKKVTKEVEKPSKKDESSQKKDEPSKKGDSKDRKPSNKEVVYKMWVKNPDKTSVEKLHEKVNGNVKEVTIRNWISGWKREKNLPACAKQ